MTILLLAALVAGGAFLAGLLGSLTGLGGGIIVVPMLTLLFGTDIRYAIGAALVAVIATSSGAASSYLRSGYTNIRVGIVLELATVVGALCGAAIAGLVPTRALGVLFGLVMLYTAYRSMRGQADGTEGGSSESDPLAVRLGMPSTYPTAAGPRAYGVVHVARGFSFMLGAGILSALLGIGSGVIKVLAMDRAMRLPFKVSTTTSNFMIGVTAAASAGVYLNRGYIDPVLAAPVMLGVVGGARVGARLLGRLDVRVLRVLFTTIAIVMAVQMLYKGLRGTL